MRIKHAYLSSLFLIFTWYCKQHPLGMLINKIWEQKCHFKAQKEQRQEKSPKTGKNFYTKGEREREQERENERGGWGGGGVRLCLCESAAEAHTDSAITFNVFFFTYFFLSAQPSDACWARNAKGGSKKERSGRRKSRRRSNQCVCLRVQVRQHEVKASSRALRQILLL